MSENLYSYVFWFNIYNNTWYAIPRDKYMDFFGLQKQDVAIKSKNINTLIELISKPQLLKTLNEKL